MRNLIAACLLVASASVLFGCGSGYVNYSCACLLNDGQTPPTQTNLQVAYCGAADEIPIAQDWAAADCLDGLALPNTCFCTCESLETECDEPTEP